jgi:hypothetical protein
MESIIKKKDGFKEVEIEASDTQIQISIDYSDYYDQYMCFLSLDKEELTKLLPHILKIVHGHKEENI